MTAKTSIVLLSREQSAASPTMCSVAGGGGIGVVPFGGNVFCRFATTVLNPTADICALLEFMPPHGSKSVTVCPPAISEFMIDWKLGERPFSEL